jgi:GTP-binding protein HflX
LREQQEAYPSPSWKEKRTHPGRLQGLRLIHTRLDHGGLTFEDLTDLAKLRLDMIYAIEVRDSGEPGDAHGAHLLPAGDDAPVWATLDPTPTYRLDLPFDEFITALEGEITRKQRALSRGAGEDRAILVSVVPSMNENAKIAISEFQSLAASAGITVMETIVQRREKPDPNISLERERSPKSASRPLRWTPTCSSSTTSSRPPRPAQYPRSPTCGSSTGPS